MSATVDDRIVNMQLNNSQFKRGATETMSLLDRLKAKLTFSGASKGLQDVQNTASRFQMGTVGAQIEGVNSKFLALSTVAVTALSMIASRAIEAGAAVANSFTFKPIMEGFREYETNLGSIQTILANTGLEGEKGLGKVEAALDELNHYSDKTIYNFSEMARNIGTFTAAGVDLDASTAAIKGIANLAAVSGSNSQQASTAMYQLSQALAAGKVNLMDWNSVVNAGMGGKVFQESLMETARVHGVAVDDIVKKAGSFRNSISKGWITSEILTETLSKFTGDLSEAQLRQMGYTEEQIAGIVKMGKTATDAATKVKSFSQLISTLQEALGSGWAQTWELLFGGFNEARVLFTDISDTLGGFIQANSDARNKVISDWKDLGGRTALIEGLGNVFKALVEVVKPVREAFREIFPPATGQSLYNLTTRFLEFTKTLKIGADTADGIKRTFAGLFAVLSIGWQIVKGLASVIGTLLGALTGSSGGVLEFTGTIGDFLVALDKALKEGNALTAFFEGLGSVLAVPVRLLGALGEIFAGLLGGFDEKKSNSISESFANLGDSMSPLAAIFGGVGGAFEGLGKIFKEVAEFLQPMVDAIVESFAGFGDALANSIQSGSFDAVLGVINTGLLGGILLLIKRFFANGLNIDFGGGMVEGITETFGALTGTLKSMQNQINAKTLLLIAGAIALLTVSIVALSGIDSKQLKKSLTAMSAGFAQLLIAMTILAKVGSLYSVISVPVLAAGLILLASAILILSAAVKNLSSLSWEELSKGLIGVTVLLGGLVLVAGPLTAASGGMIRAGAGLVVLATGLKILASVVKDLASLSWGDLAKGLLGTATALGIIVGALYIIPPNILATAAALLVFSGALKAISSAVIAMGDQSWNSVAKGLVSLAGSLAIIAGALYLFPPHMIAISAGLVLVGNALGNIADALVTMGGQSWEEIAKGMVTLAGALLILAGGLTLMSGSLAGAAALTVVAAGLTLLVPVLTTLGAMAWESIVKGLIALAGTFAVLGAAGYLLAPVTPILIGLGAAIALVGVGVAALGVGALALATAFSMVVASGSAGLAVMTAMATVIVATIPKAMGAFGQGVGEFAKQIAKSGPALVMALSAVINSVTTAIIKNAPKMTRAFGALVKAGTDAVIQNSPRITEAGFKMLMDFLRKLDANVYRITTIALSIIEKFIRAIGNNHSRVVDAGYKMIIKFMNSLAKTIRDNSDEMGEAGRNIGSAIVEGIAKGIWAGQSGVIDAALGVAGDALGAFNDFLGIFSPSREFAKSGRFIDEGIAMGLDAYSGVVESSARGVATTALETVQTTMSRVGEAMSTELDFNPTITPVLDLTKLQQEATRISSLITPGAIQPDVSTQQATSISADQAEISAANESQTPPPPPPVQLIQNNHSPKALSAIDIYRQTKSLVDSIPKP